MNKIDSFTIDHTKLLKGVYVSRKDHINNIALTTFDIRMKQPNVEPVMNTAEIHTIEHLGATFIRNHSNYKEDCIYFGPMGCRTGFYLILNGDLTSKEVLPLMIEIFEFIANFEGTVPGATDIECGNYQDMNLNMARYEAERYLKTLHNITDENLNYPN